jgi:hypothetical protein
MNGTLVGSIFNVTNDLNISWRSNYEFVGRKITA